MLSNEQAIRAFREVLTHLESEVVRADAIFELMLERGQIHPQDLEGVMESAKARQQARWSQIRANVELLLTEEGDKKISRVA